jgi:molybdopterin-guanine dinucleotide biosynthesis protein A
MTNAKRPMTNSLRPTTSNQPPATNPQPPPLTVAILAGGKSSRLGRDKAFIEVRGRPLIEDLLAQTAGLGAETLIVTNRPEAYRYLGFPLFSDVLPERGPLGGLYTALSAASQPHVLCLACDMPFVIRPLIDYLISLILEGNVDAVVPRLGGLVEPLRAVYARTCLAPMRAALETDQLALHKFLATSGLRVRFVDDPEIDRFDPRHLSFININTAEDLTRAQKLARTDVVGV